MRAPTASFKNELTAYRQRLINNPASIHVQNRGRYELTMQILDRWHAYPAAEDIWQTVKPKLPAVPSAEGLFIASILRTANTAKDIDRLLRELPSAAKKAEARIIRDVKGKRLDAAHEAISLLNKVRKGREKLSRKADTAARNRFMIILRGWFSEQCGQPFDDVVATLTNIVFDLRPKANSTPRAHVEVTADTVRDAARLRDRDIRPPK